MKKEEKELPNFDGESIFTEYSYTFIVVINNAKVDHLKEQNSRINKDKGVIQESNQNGASCTVLIQESIQ
jgi:hypothetical protein